MSHPPHDDRPRIVVLGNSLTAGHTLDRAATYPAWLQQRIDERGWSFQVINAGVNGDTSTDGLQRLPWVLREAAAVLIVELGGNDGLRGLPVDLTRRNLQAIIDQAEERHPGVTVVLAGMKMPPNYGPAYTESFEAIYPELAEKNELPLIPFLLKGVAGDPALTLPDGIHPTADGHRIIAETVWLVLQPVLEQRRQSATDPPGGRVLDRS